MQREEDAYMERQLLPVTKEAIDREDIAERKLITAHALFAGNRIRALDIETGNSIRRRRSAY